MVNQLSAKEALEYTGMRAASRRGERQGTHWWLPSAQQQLQKDPVPEPNVS